VKTPQKKEASGQVEAPGLAGLSSSEEKTAKPTTLIIFGATGDLARRKLLPAIYNLALDGTLPKSFNLIGISRSEYSDDEFRSIARDAIESFSRRKPEKKVLENLLSGMRYLGYTFNDPECFSHLRELLEELDKDRDHPFNRIYYLSTAPSQFSVIMRHLKSAKLHRQESASTRIVIEKPFGTDLESARKLQEIVNHTFREEQVFRIDHYLGKETVQNLLAFRFANSMFEPLWNRRYIDHVQITAAEDLGIGSRAGYYEHAGALRDLVQNHMLQLLTLVCMEPPANFDADKVRDEKVKVLQAIPAPTVEAVKHCVTRAQYSAGEIDGEKVLGYLDEDGVSSHSTTETYVALKLGVYNWRWEGVPIFLRTGKRLAGKLTEIAVQLRPVPHLAFKGEGNDHLRPNTLVLSIQPDEGVSLSFGAKVPGAGMHIRPVDMEFNYETEFLSQSPEAYERLLLDAIKGEATLFTRDDEVDAQWTIIDPILEAWKSTPGPLKQYPAGSQGPESADKLLGETNHWRDIPTDDR
jgi:glucose-6-phosphate 1-dehydrogenase